MRTFICIDLPNDVLDEIVKIQERLSKTNLIKGKFIEKQNIHLTLKFLGEIDEDKLNDVKEKLNELKFKKLDLKLSKLGVFNEKYIRIVWISVVGQELFELQKDIDFCLKDLFEKEDRFMGHITIARPKFVKNAKRFLEELGNTNFSKLNFEADKIYLKKSELTTLGPRYETLMKISWS